MADQQKRRKHKNLRHSDRTLENGYKSKLPLEAIKEQQILVELAERFQVPPNQIVTWKRQLLGNAQNAFGRDKDISKDATIKELHAKIGQLAMENDFLSGALGRIGDTSAKK